MNRLALCCIAFALLFLLALQPWFESLPAVLIFSLGRYFFNGTKGETEKLNMRFHFPRTIFMDRYMARYSIKIFVPLISLRLKRSIREQ